MEIEVPANKVKLVIGAGGEKIKWIQRKSKCRVQVGGWVGGVVGGWVDGGLEGMERRCNLCVCMYLCTCGCVCV
jgi:hypothetical protein